jgi:superfamily II DNA or RNA helicase
VAEIDDIVHSWKDALVLREEEDKNLGFRSVQVGAISAIKAHFISKPERKAIVVMPTGTGKTDVMIATMVGEQLKRTLILVPSAMLRHQIAEKFKSFGILKQYYLVKPGALMPLTEELKTWPKVPEDFFTNRNVLVATPSIFRGHEQELPYLVKDFEALFIDEAHHMPAQTWQVVGNAFKRKKIIQFTATPFRNDGKLLLGEIIFNYSLSLALKAGYFTEIDFEPIEQFDTEKEDADISSKAIELLRKDIAQGFDHKLLVRAKTMKRAAILYNEYYNISSTNDLCPVLITSNKSSTKPKNAVALYNEGKAKIVVAVDMFKEGIDDAKFKIGALHDKYKSLPVTLQFLGRLTRVEPCKLGHAKLVANLVNDDFIPELQDLYSEDTDWTFLLPKLSDYAITKRISFQQLLEEFNKKDETSQRDLEYVLAHFRPQFSMKVYSIPEDSFIPHNITNMNKQEGTIYSNRENTILLWVYTSQENIEWMPNSDCKNKKLNLHRVANPSRIE